MCVLPLCVCSVVCTLFACVSDEDSNVHHVLTEYRVLCFFGEILDRTPGVQDPEPETGKS